MKARRLSQKPRLKNDNVDVLEGPGFRMERHGRFINYRTNRTPEEQKELMKHLKDWANSIPEEIKKKVHELEERLSQFDLFDILANLSFANLFTNPENYKEYLHEGRSAFVEFASLLCLKKPYSEGKEFQIKGDDVKSIQKILHDVFQYTAWLESTRHIDPERKVHFTDLQFLQYSVRLNELIVRNPAYQHHLYEVLEGLFDQFGHILHRTIGFTLMDALNLSSSIADLIDKRLRERMSVADKNSILIRSEVNSYRKTNKFQYETCIDEKAIRHLATMSYKRMSKLLRNILIAWVFLGFGETCSYTASELSLQCEIEEDRAHCFLNLLSLKFGSIDPDFYIPSPVHPLKRRPFLNNNGRYFCPSPLLLDYAFQPALEEAIKNSSGNVWTRYAEHRHKYLLSKAIENINKMMPAAHFEFNLEYEFISQKKNQKGELDALGIYDSILFLVEAKAGSITEPARRGAPERLQKHLRELIKDAHYQGMRASTFVNSQEFPLFIKKDRTKFRLEKTNIRSIVLVSLTLEPLGHLTSLIHSKSNVGIFQEGDLPWVISLYDLMVISDIIDISSMLPHYIKRRIRATEQGILAAHDELDIFSYYLKEGLYLENMNESDTPEKVNLASYTADFDDYYLYKTGVRRHPAVKPQQEMPAQFKLLLRSLERSNLPFRVDAGMRLLDTDFKSRKTFIKLVREAKDKYRKDGRIHDFSIHGNDDGGWGITYFNGPDEVLVNTRLKEYCTRKKEQFSSKSWVGIGDVGLKTYKISSIVSL